MEVCAPGVVKLLGEHAVVYDKLAVAAAIDIKAKVRLEDVKSSTMEITLSDMGVAAGFTAERLGQLYKSYRENNIADFIAKNSDIDKRILPYAAIAARLAAEEGLNASGLTAVVTSDIPVQKGYASSAACSTAFAVALSKKRRLQLSDSVVIDIARDGDRVIHQNPNAGAIDISTAYYGGVVSFRKADGPHTEEVPVKFGLVLIDTGPKKSTAETVGHVRDLVTTKPEATKKILDNIDSCSVEGLECLKKGDIKGLGTMMNRDQELLAQLDLSTPGLDTATRVARESGAYGAKLSGGGGGGVAIALVDNPEPVMAALRMEGFRVAGTTVAKDGAMAYLKSKSAS
jgi:mevalonate kinase